nr:hypothetical protein CKG001_10260 [Bdellovibrio sp. CKG001]
MTEVSDKAMDLFKDLVWDSLVKAAITRMFVAMPALAWGPFGVFVTWVVTKFADRLYEHAREYVALETIAFKNKQLEKEFDRRLVMLRIIERESGLGSEAFKKGREDAKKALSDVVRYDVARAA